MKNPNRIITLFLLVFLPFNLMAQDIIPAPSYVKKLDDAFELNRDTRISFTKGLQDQAMLLADYLSPATGFDFEISEGLQEADNVIILTIDESLPDEGYELLVETDRISIRGKNAAGVFYGAQTLRQLLPVEIYNKVRQKEVRWEIGGIHVQDDPEYKWRGMMLDVSRYFYHKDYVLKFMDMMAMYKFNSLQLHLIDDSGWRLEIKKYPKLTSIGAWSGEGEDRMGGYYTQEDIREMVAYAAMRNIDIIPEIEVPAHTLAAIAAYPYLSCRETPVKVQTQHSISRELYCVGKESTFEFLGDVFEEAFQLFPSKYIHIGGDEARYDRWKECAHCQKRKMDLGLKEEKELQTYFNQRIQEMVKPYGKTIVGWDEIIEEGLEHKAVGMVWHNRNKAFVATELGHDIVLALTTHCYFDFPESNIPGEVKAATWMPPISLEKVYHFDPVIEGLNDKYRPQILGGQAQMWSDQFIQGTILQEIAPINENRSEAYFDYLAFPRMAALAEVLWSGKENQNWNKFQDRMRTHYNRYDHAGYSYRVPQPKLIEKKEEAEGVLIALENMVEDAEIRYTTNGIKPNVYSEIYSGPVRVNRLEDFQAITVVSRKHYSLPLYFPVEYPEFKKFGDQIGQWRPIDLVEGYQVEIIRKATGKINQNGKYQVSFLHVDGNSKLEIEKIMVFKNNSIFSDDINMQILSDENNVVTYQFEVDNYETGAEYTVKAKVKTQNGNDSNGVIFLKMM